MPDANPILIALPYGLVVSGVSVWAVRLANALAAEGRAVSILRHAPMPGYAPLDLPIDPRVTVVPVPDPRHPDETGGDRSVAAPTYLRTLLDLNPTPERPAIVLPNLQAECFGLVASITQLMGDRVRVVGWQHSDIPYDTAVLAHHEPMLSAFVAVSAEIEQRLRDTLPIHRLDAIHRIPYGVPIHPAPAPLDPSEPLPVLYAGRLEDIQKRVRVLEHLAAFIERGDAPLRLTIIGDGPAASRVEQSVAGFHRVTVRPGLPPAALDDERRHHAVFVLTSRYEGLSIALLEAMGAGLCPVVTRVRSGTGELIDEGESGVTIDPEGDDAPVARRLYDALAELANDRDRLDRLRTAAHARAQHYSIEHHASLVSAMFDRVARQPARWWPPSRPTGFETDAAIGATSGSSTVPADAPRRLERTLAALAAEGVRGVVLYGAGAHTVALAGTLARSPVPVHAVIDDAAPSGRTLWGWPVLTPDDPRVISHVHEGAAIVISSWIHRDAMTARARTVFGNDATIRGLYEPVEPVATAHAAGSNHG